ncbi:MAG: double-strand break repair helicase AddA, partial [Pseudomonadota bacterium]|nr:double-strand break repair helicase AddA [Pseudomonadota bacterium]
MLKTVDAVFEGDTARQGVVEPGEMLQHNVHRTGAPGRVELWPVVQAEEQSELLPWAPPVVRRHQDDPESRLASVIAAKIRYWLDHDALTSKDGTKRPVQAGDVMILVRRRRRIVDRLVRALKDAGVPVAGVDRLVLTQQLSVMDLVALANFLLLPDDDLTLATVLKGPLIGFDDDDLFELAFDRGERSLWQILVARAAEIEKFDQARLWLGDMLARADFVAPYELFAGILTRPTINGESGRKAMISRLGAEAEDPLDEFLNLALDYEHSETPSLQGFLHWVAAEETEVKRDLEQNDRDEVRVMTVHGAKGLQAPIVVMADTLSA